MERTVRAERTKPFARKFDQYIRYGRSSGFAFCCAFPPGTGSGLMQHEKNRFFSGLQLRG